MGLHKRVVYISPRRRAGKLDIIDPELAVYANLP